MIYVHKFNVAFGHKQQEIKKIYDSREEALAQRRVLGGVVMAYKLIDCCNFN